MARLVTDDTCALIHGDPADRLIVATALIHGLEIVTLDQKLLRNPGIPTFR